MAAAFRPVWGYTPAAPEGVDTFHLSVLPPVRPTIALLRTPRFPQRSGHLLRLLPDWPCSIHRQTPEHLFGTPCRTARRSGSWAIPSLCRATPSATSEHLMGLLGSSPIPRSLVASCVSFQLRPLPSAGITRLPRYYGPLRHPKRPGLSLASCQLIRNRDHRWNFPCYAWPPFASMPSPIPRQVGWNLFAHTIPSASAFPIIGAGR